MSCSISGFTSVTFSISNYFTAAPAWVTIDPISGILSIEAPEVNADTNYDFYINSAIVGISNPVQKLIKLTVINCSVINWKKCVSTSGSTWEVCNNGYDLTTGTWVVQNTNTTSTNTTSETAQALSTATTSAVAATTGIVVLTSLANTASIASLWMTINQLQLFF